MITEDYVNFENAKLLKEKGFDEPCYAYWHEDENKLIFSYSMHAIRNITNPCFFGPAAPTLQMVMKWLREVHKINIEIITYWTKDKSMVYGNRMVCDATLLKEIDVAYNSYEEACERAIKYCLENLI